MISINIAGVKKASLVLTGALFKTKLAQKEGLKKAALFVHGKVKSSIAGREAEPTSVDTGRLLNSVNFKASQKNAVVFTEIPYARFIELGTSKFTGRHHFRNTSSRSKEKVKDIIANEIKSI